MDELIVVVTMPGSAQRSARAFRGTVVVGRGDDCDLVLPHRLVSRRHAELARTDEGTTVIRDLGSSNGIVVDGRELRDGDATVQIGPYSLLVSGEASSAEGTLVLTPDAASAALGALRDEDEALRDETGLPNRRRFNDRLEEAVAEAGTERRSLAVVNVNVNRLKVEVTETAVMDDPQAAGRVLREIRELGVSVSFDDFGVWQASLTHLRDLPIDEIKIDRTFVVKLSEGEADAAFVRTFVELGHALELVVTAEGVETAEQFEAVARLGCDLVQGYYISRPLAESDLFQWLEGRGAPAISSGP